MFSIKQLLLLSSLFCLSFNISAMNDRIGSSWFDCFGCLRGKPTTSVSASGRYIIEVYPDGMLVMRPNQQQQVQPVRPRLAWQDTQSSSSIQSTLSCPSSITISSNFESESMR